MKTINIKVVFPTALLCLLLPVAIWALVSEKNTVIKPVVDVYGLVLYYGNTCPHCKLVENYLDTNDKVNSLELSRKEVYDNTKNQQELIARAAACGINGKSVGVPFLWDNGKCLIGDQDIIKSLGDKLKK